MSRRARPRRPRTAIVIVTVYAAALAIWAATIAATDALTHTAHGKLPACQHEDGPGPCYWNAATAGNGTGRSFWIDANQTTHYTGENAR